MTDDSDRANNEFFPSAPLENLRFRARLLVQLRNFFSKRGFFEVSTPVMASETVVDVHLDPFRLILPANPQRPDEGPVAYLQTSPEFHMKRLLVAGAQAIYQIGPALRCGESGAFHNTEFTMVEWYRCGDNLEQGMRLLAELAEELLGSRSTELLTYAAAFQQHLEVNPHKADTKTLQLLAMSRCSRAQVDGDCRDGLLELLFSELIQPQLGQLNPTILYEYPANQAMLAQIRPGPPAVAERFELFYHGIELANGYHELSDPDELEARFRQANQVRVANGKQVLPMPRRFLEAMKQGLPPCAGTALGFDRLVMSALGVDDIGQVIPFPINLA